MLHTIPFDASGAPVAATSSRPTFVPMGEQAAGIVHDLGNLIQIAKSALNILGRHDTVATDQSLSPILERAGTSLDRAAALVSRTMDRTRLCSALAAADRETTDIGRCLAEVRSLIACLCEPAIEVVMRIEPGLPLVNLRPIDLQNAVLNLVINSRDAMEHGGRLSIEASRGFDPRIGSGVVITVTDDGAGMSPETLARACEALFTTKSAGRGTGLGLATVQHLVDEAGGELAITSEPRRGTTVCLHLLSVAPSEA